MSNYYKQLFNSYISKLNSTRVSYKTIFSRKLSLTHRLIYYFEKTLSWTTKSLSKNKINCILLYKDNYFVSNADQFEETYNNLNDEYSRANYIEYLSFKMIRSNSIKLNNERMDIKKDLALLDKCRVVNPSVNRNAGVENSELFDLAELGCPVKLIHSPIGVLLDFVYEQYAYKDIFSVINNDVVIDCGGATGDTAIYFAAKGASIVYVFEFVKSNIEFINKQLKLNPGLQNKVVIIDKPVWEASNVELSYFDKGNSSRVDSEGVYPNKIITLSIDDMVIKNEINNVDLIKMDIEGAEMPALIGAENTIRKFKPKLAISVYHKKDDLITIPRYIKEINPGYDFYFDYYTDIGWEAVLYAIDRSAL